MASLVSIKSKGADERCDLTAGHKIAVACCVNLELNGRSGGAVVAVKPIYKDS